MSTEATGEDRPPDAPNLSCRILVVDDDAPAAKLLGQILGKLGDHHVIAAHDGPSALAAEAEFQPDLILLDNGLPKMDGDEVARRLRAMPAFRDTLLVALTGHGTQDDRRRSIEAGFDDHVTKPPGVDLLRKVLAHAKLRRTRWRSCLLAP